MVAVEVVVPPFDEFRVYSSSRRQTATEAISRVVPRIYLAQREIRQISCVSRDRNGLNGGIKRQHGRYRTGRPIYVPCQGELPGARGSHQSVRKSRARTSTRTDQWYGLPISLKHLIGEIPVVAVLLLRAPYFGLCCPVTAVLVFAQNRVRIFL